MILPSAIADFNVSIVRSQLTLTHERPIAVFFLQMTLKRIKLYAAGAPIGGECQQHDLAAIITKAEYFVVSVGADDLWRRPAGDDGCHLVEPRCSEIAVRLGRRQWCCFDKDPAGARKLQIGGWDIAKVSDNAAEEVFDLFRVLVFGEWGIFLQVGGDDELPKTLSFVSVTLVLSLFFVVILWHVASV